MIEHYHSIDKKNENFNTKYNGKDNNRASLLKPCFFGSWGQIYRHRTDLIYNYIFIILGKFEKSVLAFDPLDSVHKNKCSDNRFG